MTNDRGVRQGVKCGVHSSDPILFGNLVLGYQYLGFYLYEWMLTLQTKIYSLYASRACYRF